MYQGEDEGAVLREGRRKREREREKERCARERARKRKTARNVGRGIKREREKHGRAFEEDGARETCGGGPVPGTRARTSGLDAPHARGSRART